METFEPEIIALKSHPELNEVWLQNQIAQNPAILGLGELDLRDRERRQPAGGRLDLLLQDPETLHRYEVEIQLGKTDESHIIRTIEYWDLERRRYPQYEHTAVIVAEDVTSRFLNVISLFNGFIPLIAIKLQAILVDGRVGLIFTRVLDKLPLGPVEEDEGVTPVDRTYWEQRATAKTVKLADRLLEIIETFAPGYELKYNRHYIGLAKNGQPNNFVKFRPRKKVLKFQVRLPQSRETDDRLEQAELEVLEYDRRWGHYNIRLSEGDILKHKDLLAELMRAAYQETEPQT